MMMMSARLGLERSLLIPVSNMSCLANAGSSSQGRISRYVCSTCPTSDYVVVPAWAAGIPSLSRGRFETVAARPMAAGEMRALPLPPSHIPMDPNILVRTTNPTCLLLLLCSCSIHTHTPGDTDVLPCVLVEFLCCRGCVMLDVIFRLGHLISFFTLKWLEIL